MHHDKVFRRERLSFSRKAVRASASASRKKNAIHAVTEIDLSIPRALLVKCGDSLGRRPSFTAYIVKCFSNVIEHFPEFNAFISGNHVVYLDDVTISVLVEREIGKEAVPEPVGIRACQKKSYQEISDEIREYQLRKDEALGKISGLSWLAHLPAFLLGAFIALADRNISMGLKYGKLAVTSVGMFGKEAMWFIPHGSATVLLTVGSIIRRAVEVEGGLETREHLCLTVSFDHDIIDGAPAARFMQELISEIRSGREISGLIDRGASLDEKG